MAAGRRWLRSYINGCGNKVWRAALHDSLKGKTFSEAAEWTYRTAGFVLIGDQTVCHFGGCCQVSADNCSVGSLPDLKA